MAPKKQAVSFTATKKVKEPTDVKFKTKGGTKVSFEAEKTVNKKVCQGRSKTRPLRRTKLGHS